MHRQDKFAQHRPTTLVVVGPTVRACVRAARAELPSRSDTREKFREGGQVGPRALWHLEFRGGDVVEAVVEPHVEPTVYFIWR